MFIGVVRARAGNVPRVRVPAQVKQPESSSNA